MSTRKPSVRKSPAASEKAGPSELQIQTALFRWAAVSQKQYPALRWMFAVPNGMHSDPRHVRRHKAAGLRPGVPDVWLPVPRPPYAGLVMELKSAKGRVSDEQAAWLAALVDLGYLVSVERTLESAISQILAYLMLPAAAKESE